MLSKLFTAHYVLFIKLVLVGLVSPEPSFKRFRWKDYINFATNQLSDSSKWQLCTPYPRKKTSPHIRLSLCHACFLHVSLVAPCTDPLLTTQPSNHRRYFLVNHANSFHLWNSLKKGCALHFSSRLQNWCKNLRMCCVIRFAERSYETITNQQEMWHRTRSSI